MVGAEPISIADDHDVFSIIAEEAGVTKNELFEAEDFADLGIDDVLSVSITRKASETLGLELPRTIFQTYPEVKDFQTYISETSSPTTPAPKATSAPSNVAPAPKTGRKPPAKTKAPLSILLQGNPKTSRKTIFLLPDGSGSGMVYSQFPQIGSDISLVALNSPFLNCDNFSTTIEDLATMWAEEIRKRQPKGPYILGGYSAGGYYSFEVAKQIQREGDVVEKLVLIDSPCRLNFEPLPMQVIYFLAEQGFLGNWGSKKTPDWFIDHFEGTIDAVAKYQPTEMEAQGQLPECFIIWASDGVLKGRMEPEETGLDLNVNVTRFMLENKKDFGLHGWDKLMPGASVSVNRVPGNHFSMVHPPNCNPFGDLLQDVLEDKATERKNAWRVTQL